jgi:hypothetical protein
MSLTRVITREGAAAYLDPSHCVGGDGKRRSKAARSLPQPVRLCESREPIKSRILVAAQGQSKWAAKQSQLGPAAVPGSRPTNRSNFPPSILSGCKILLNA